MRKLDLWDTVFSIILLALLLSGSPALAEGASYVASGVAVTSLLIMAVPVARARLAEMPQSVKDLLLSMVVIYVMVRHGYLVAASLYGSAVAVEIHARRFKFVLL